MLAIFLWVIVGFENEGRKKTEGKLLKKREGQKKGNRPNPSPASNALET